MTYTIPPESPRRVASRKFALAFTAALANTGISKRELASRLTGRRSSRSSIQLWAKGQSLPTVETARRLDEILGTELEQLIIESRRVECQNGCGRTVIVRGNAARTRYCSPSCAKQAGKVRTGLMPKRDTLLRRLGLHQEAVAAYCAECEPDGICRTATCPLRSVSPFPLLGTGRPPVRHQALAIDGLETRRRVGEASRSSWARLTPAERSARVEKIRQGRWGEREAS